MTIDRGQHPITSDVKLSILVQMGSLDVLLHNEGSQMIIMLVGCHDILDILEIRCHCNAISSVSVFTRLNNPDIQSLLSVL